MGAVEQVVVTGAGTELAPRLRRRRVPVRAVARGRMGLDPRVSPRSSPSSGKAARSFTRMTRTPSRSRRCAALGGRPTRIRRDAPSRLPPSASGRWRRAQPGHRDLSRGRRCPRGRRHRRQPDHGRPVRYRSRRRPRRTLPIGIRGRLGLPADATIAANVAALVGHKDHATLLRAADALAHQHPASSLGPCGRGTRCVPRSSGSGRGLGSRRHVSTFWVTFAIRSRLIADADVYRHELEPRGPGHLGSRRHGAWHSGCVHHRRRTARHATGRCGSAGSAGRSRRAGGRGRTGS